MTSIVNMYGYFLEVHVKLGSIKHKLVPVPTCLWFILVPTCNAQC